MVHVVCYYDILFTGYCVCFWFLLLLYGVVMAVPVATTTNLGEYIRI